MKKGRGLGCPRFIKFRSREKGKDVNENKWDGWWCHEEDVGMERDDIRNRSWKIESHVCISSEVGTVEEEQ